MGSAELNQLAVEAQADLYCMHRSYRPIDEPSGEPQDWYRFHFALPTQTPIRGYRGRYRAKAITQCKLSSLKSPGS